MKKLLSLVIIAAFAATLVLVPNTKVGIASPMPSASELTALAKSNKPVILPIKTLENKISKSQKFSVVEKAYNNGKLVMDMGQAWKSKTQINMLKKKVSASCTFTVNDGKNFSASKAKADLMSRTCSLILLKEGVSYIEQARLLGDAGHPVWKKSQVGILGNTRGAKSLLLYKSHGVWKSSVCTNSIWLSPTKPRNFVKTYTQSQKAKVKVKASGSIKRTVKKVVSGYCSLTPKNIISATATAVASSKFSATFSYTFSVKNHFKVIGTQVWGNSIVVKRWSELDSKLSKEASQDATLKVTEKLSFTCPPPAPPIPCKWNSKVTQDDPSCLPPPEECQWVKGIPANDPRCKPETLQWVKVRMVTPHDLFVNGSPSWVYISTWNSEGGDNTVTLTASVGTIGSQTKTDIATCQKQGVEVGPGASCYKVRFTPPSSTGEVVFTATAVNSINGKSENTTSKTLIDPSV